jgi:hypothetical protein
LCFNLGRHHEGRKHNDRLGGIFIVRAYGALLAVLIALTGSKVSAQATVQSELPPSQISAAPIAETAPQVLLTALNKGGYPIPAPGSESIQLHIGGQSIHVDQIISLKSAPLYFSVLVDVSRSTKASADQEIAAASKLFHDLSGSGNQGYLIVFNSQIAKTDHSLSPAEADEILSHYPAKNRSGESALFDAVFYAANEQLNFTNVPRVSRRAIFLFSHGDETVSKKNLADTIKEVQREGVPIFSFLFSSDDVQLASSDKDLNHGWAKDKRGGNNLTILSDETGGLWTVLARSGNPIGYFVDVANWQYALSFKPLSLNPQKSYHLKIESSDKQIRLLSSTEYFVH